MDEGIYDTKQRLQQEIWRSNIELSSAADHARRPTFSQTPLAVPTGL
jgi:hypothetical protein